MDKDTICIRRAIKPTKEQRRILLREMNSERIRAYLRRDEKRESIRKKDLKNHKILAIQIMPNWPEDMICQRMGLFETGIDEEKKTMRGIRILFCSGEYEFEEYTFDLDKYGTDWVAFDK